MKLYNANEAARSAAERAAMYQKSEILENDSEISTGNPDS